MYRIFLHGKTIYIFDKTEKEFREAYGNGYEQIAVIKNSDNLEPVVEKLGKQYRVQDVVYDCHIKKKFGWKYHSEEVKALLREKWSQNRRNRTLSDHHRKRISEGKTGKRGSHTGCKHNEDTKILMSLKSSGHKRNAGKIWCYNPVTGQERKYNTGEEPPEGFIKGRNPDLEFGKNFRSF